MLSFFDPFTRPGPRLHPCALAGLLAPLVLVGCGQSAGADESSADATTEGESNAGEGNSDEGDTENQGDERSGDGAEDSAQDERGDESGHDEDTASETEDGETTTSETDDTSTSTSTSSDATTDGDDDDTSAVETSSAEESADGDASEESSETGDEDPGYGREVLSWVPPYDVERGLANLERNLGSHSPNTVMTHIALQFWRPTNSGGLVYESGVGDDDVAKFRALCDQYDIRLILTVYNNNQQNPGWDWGLARQAFAGQRDNFVRALVDEVTRLGLDGVDIDLEGLGGHDEDRQDFAAFIVQLGDELHQLDKQLTVDSFHSPCYNAPNMAWWEDWVGYVDHVHSMGYSQMYEGNNNTFDDCPSDPDAANEPFFKYSYHRAYGRRAGFGDRVVSVGLPASNSWGGGSLEQHLRDIIDLEDPASICIWDFSLSGSAWRQEGTWSLVEQIRNASR